MSEQHGAAMSMRVCITGGIACGKTLVGEFAANLGIPVRDADDICHDLMAAGGELRDRIIAAFGPDIQGENGEIDRRALARLVCDNPERRERLNGLVHPPARRELESWFSGVSDRPSAKECRAPVARAGIAAAIIPLVFEAGWEDSWDRIVCVAAPARLQISRLSARGLSQNEALAWIKAQMPLEEKMRRSDYVVFNSGSKDCARMQTVRIFESILEQVEKHDGNKK